MRLFTTILMLFVLSAGIVLAGNVLHFKEGQDNGNDDNGSDRGQNQTLEIGQNRTHDLERENETEIERNQTKEQEKEKNQTREQEKDKNETGKGISEQVHQIIEGRKNGSITVPQGFLVRIIAKNHTLSVANATEILNRSLNASFIHKGKNKTLKFELDDDNMNISDENFTVQTNETVEIENETFSVSGKKVLIMPSEVPAKIRAKTIRSAVLHVVNGDPEYQVNATRGAMVLWIFDADMDVESTLDANTGKIKSENRPWWSFLASTED